MTGLFYLTIIVFGSCSSSTQLTKINNIDNSSDTIKFKPAVAAGVINNKVINEASGIVMSLQDKDFFWTHNDSGDDARLFLVSTDAEYRFTCTVANIKNRDWEDIAIYNDSNSGKSRLYIGDIGDNNAVYPFCNIYIIDEPSVKSTSDITISKSEKIIYKYSDGRRDAETLMVDPVNGDIYIVSKRETNVNIYRIAYPYSFKDTMTAEKMLTIPLNNFVGGDISRDGSEILMKTYQKIYYWPRKKGKTIIEALSQKPIEIPYQIEPQGEAICWSADAKSFYTLSEASPFNVTPVLYRYDKE